MLTLFTPKGIQLVYAKNEKTVRANYLIKGELPEKCPICGSDFAEKDCFSIRELQVHASENNPGDVICDSMTVAARCDDDYDGCGKNFDIKLSVRPVGVPFVEDAEIRNNIESRLVAELKSLLEEFKKKDKGMFAPEADVIEFVPCEGNCGICAVPEIKLGPVSLELTDAYLEKDGHFTLVFSDREFCLEYNTAELDVHFLDALYELIVKCRSALPRKKTVRVYLNTFVDVEVKATDRFDAIDQAKSICSDMQAPGWDKELYDNLSLTDDFDVNDID